MTVRDVLNMNVGLLVVAIFIMLLLINLFKRVISKKERINERAFMSRRIQMLQGKRYIFKYKVGLFTKEAFEIKVISSQYHEMFIFTNYKGTTNVEVTLFTDDMMPIQRISFYDVEWEELDIE